MQYAVDKAVRRGIKQLPEPLMRFVAEAGAGDLNRAA
jgi:hypothetical protein